MVSTEIRSRVVALGLALTAALGLSSAASPAGAQAAQVQAGPQAQAGSGISAEELLLQMQLCRSLSNRAFRLNCFDGLARELPRQGGTPAASAPQDETLARAGDAPTAAQVPMPVPMPPPRPARPFDLAKAQLPAMEAVGRKVAVAIAGPSGTDWTLAPSPPVQVARSPRRDSYEVVDSLPLGAGGPPPTSLFAEALPAPARQTPPQETETEIASAGGEAAQAAEPAASEAPAESAPEAATPVVAAAPENVPPAETQAGPAEATGEPESAYAASEFASLFEFGSPAQAATHDGALAVPLPPDPPERAPSFVGMLEGAVPIDGPLPQPEPVEDDETLVDPAIDEPPMQTASLGDVTVTPTIKRNWSVSGWTSPLSGARDMTITRASERADQGPVTLLSFYCGNDTGAVRVVWPSGVSGRQLTASLSFDGAASDEVSWSVGPDGRTMSRTGRSEALAVARKVADAERVTVRIAGDPAHEWEASFGTDGLASHLKDFGAACNG